MQASHSGSCAYLGLARSMMRVAPVTLAVANEFVGRLHRHSKPVVGHRFSVGVEAKTRLLDGPEWVLVGVAIIGRPVAPRLDDGRAAEITRVCTDGTKNASSMLYGAARRACKALGYGPVYTYTLPEEGGTSLRAAGFVLDKEDAGGPAATWHNRAGRKVEPIGDDLFGGKWRWVAGRSAEGADATLNNQSPDGGENVKAA